MTPANRRPRKVPPLEVAHVDQEKIRNLKIVSLILIGFFASILSGLLGIGGGAVLVPAMVLLLGMSQHKAHGTSLAVISVVVLASAILYSRHGYVDWTIAIELMVGGVVGAAIGARICRKLSAAELKRYFGIFLAFIGARMLWGAVAYAETSRATGLLAIDPAMLGGGALVLFIGLITGIFSGLFGVGGGIIMVPALTLLLGLTQKAAQGISLAVIIPVSISGALIHNSHGNVRWGMALWLAVGGILGGLVGAVLAVERIPDAGLKAMFGVLMLVTGVLMFRKKRQPACD